MSNRAAEGMEYAKQQTRDDLHREGRAYKTSGPWFLAAAACIVLGVVLTLVGVQVVAAVPFLAGIVLLFLGMHKHGKAGGDDTTVWHGMNIAD